MTLHLYLAPHLDDVVLSCGGLIARQVRSGERALILTVFTADPPAAPPTAFAEELAARAHADRDYTTIRRAEDRAAAASLGADCIHWPYPDCIYRRDPETGEPLYRNADEIFGQIAPHERRSLAGELAVRLQALCDELRPAVVYAPLTIGHHVDHHLVHWAARRLTCRGWDLRFYEDYPYSAMPAAVEAMLEESGTWQMELEPLSPADLEAKIKAIACYRSQLQGLFRGAEAMPERVKAHFHSFTGDGPAEPYRRPGLPGEASL